MRRYKINELFKTSWEELSQKQFLDMLELSEVQTRLKPGTKEYGFLIINTLRTLRKNKSVVAKFSIEQAVDCFNAIKFFRRKEGGFETPWYFFPVPNFTVSRVRFIRPGFKFKKPALIDDMPCFYLSFGQLVYADSIFSNFNQLNYLVAKKQYPELIKDITNALHALAAVLYCSGQFDPGLIDRNAKLVSMKLTVQQCLLIMHTYANYREYIVARCPNLFGTNKSTPDVPEGLPPAEPLPPPATGEMWQNLLYDLAETEAFKGYQNAFNARAYEALDLIEKKSREASERKTKKEYAQV